MRTVRWQTSHVSLREIKCSRAKRCSKRPAKGLASFDLALQAEELSHAGRSPLSEMRPIFTVHAGEYLVGCEIEANFPDRRVWIPSRDVGVDLLVTDALGRRSVSIQVKFSKDHLAAGTQAGATAKIKSGGWWTLDRSKLAGSIADLWVLVLCEFAARKYDYLVISPKELVRRYAEITPSNDPIQTYFWVTHSRRCWETRGLAKSDLSAVCSDTFENPTRDFSAFLNRWPFAVR